MGRQVEKGGVLRPLQSGRRDATHRGQPESGSCGGAFGGRQDHEIVWRDLALGDFGNSPHLLWSRNALAITPLSKRAC